MKMLKKEKKIKVMNAFDLKIMLNTLLYSETLTSLEIAIIIILTLLCLSPTRRIKQGIFEKLYQDHITKVPHSTCYRAIRFLAENGIIRIIKYSPKNVYIYLNPEVKSYIWEWFNQFKELYIDAERLDKVLKDEKYKKYL